MKIVMFCFTDISWGKILPKYNKGEISGDGTIATCTQDGEEDPLKG